MLEEDYRKALIVVRNNLIGSEFDFRPLSYNLASNLAEYCEMVLSGMTPQEIEEKMTKEQNT